jgi:TRAP transporter TAXI family solute receptor
MKIIYSSLVLVYGNEQASRPIAEDHCIDTDTLRERVETKIAEFNLTRRCIMFFLKRGIQLCAAILVSVFLIHVSSDGAWAAQRKPLAWATTASSSGVFSYHVAAAKVLNDNVPEINLSVRATGGGNQNARMLQKNETDIAAMDSSTGWEAAQGQGNFVGKPYNDIRLLYVSMTNALQIVVSERSGVKTARDLEGKTLCPGMLGGSTEKAVVDIFKVLGVNVKIRNMGYADAIEAMKNEQVTGFGKRGTRDSSVLDVMSSMKVRLISFTDEEIVKMLKVVPGNRKVVVPAGTYEGIPAFTTIENEWVDTVSKDFPADLAYKIVKALWENRADIQKSYPTFLADRFPEVSLGVTTIQMHPGAIKFYQELGRTVPQRLIPPEMGGK